MSEEKFPRCCECGSEVKMFPGKERTYGLYTKLEVYIPDDYLLPTCVKCGEWFSTVDSSEGLQVLLHKKYHKSFDIRKVFTVEYMPKDVITAIEQGCYHPSDSNIITWDVCCTCCTGSPEDTIVDNWLISQGAVKGEMVFISYWK